MARTKKTVVSGISREQAEQAFADFAAADAKVQNLTSKMDIEMTHVREKYAGRLAELSDVKNGAFEIMQAYAVENKEELFATNLCKELLPAYIRTSEELAKDKLLADRELPEVAEYFPKIGVQVVQDETFYVEPKKENDAPPSA